MEPACMKNKDTAIRKYDDGMLDKERPLRISKTVLVVMIGVFLFFVVSAAFLIPDRQSFYGIVLPLLVMLLALRLTDGALHHIQSIKLYRDEIDRLYLLSCGQKESSVSQKT